MNFYITTTLPYANSDPHIGFASEILRADVIARWKRLNGDMVFFNTGTDEHGQKILTNAENEGVDVMTYLEPRVNKFRSLRETLDLSFDNFIRTTDPEHVKATQEFWKRCEANGDIYKKKYQVKYCVGCELEKTDKELDKGKCPLHPNMDLELIDEENYFFRFSAYADKLLDLYKQNPAFIIPEHRMNEIRNFIEAGLQDFSISRLKEKMSWGVPVPGDDSQVMYVWFDALVNYISCLGWGSEKSLPLGKGEDRRGSDEKPHPDPLLSKEREDDPSTLSEGGGEEGVKNLSSKFSSFWPGMQVCGKDNLRQQTAMWQAMLMSASLPTSSQVLVFGFITSNGQKMSKSLGNVVDPIDLVNKYGIDPVRYFLLAELNPFEDSDFSYEKFETRYTSDLANGIGNLVARVSNMIEKNDLSFQLKKMNIANDQDNILRDQFKAELDIYRPDEALKLLWTKIKECDEILSDKKPWKVEDKEEIRSILWPIAQTILDIAFLLQPIMPSTADKIIEQFSAENIKKGEVLFPRLEK